DPRVLQELVQPVGLAGAVLNENLTVPREVREFAYRRRRHEAAPQQPVLQALRDPRTVLHVGLPTRNLFDVGGVAEQTREVLFEDVVNRLPVTSGALQGHVGDSVSFQPITQGQQLRCRRPKGPHLLFARSPQPRYPHARRYRLLVYVQPTHPVDQPLHRATSSARVASGPEEPRSGDFARRARWQQCGVPRAPTSDYLRTRGTKFSRRSLASGAGRPYSIFMMRGWATGPCRLFGTRSRTRRAARLGPGAARSAARATRPLPVPVSPRRRIRGRRWPARCRSSSWRALPRTVSIAGLSPSNSARGSMIRVWSV